ncbi:MAG: gliding motility lipoprotein GldH [Bacteroidales bacterium]|nr:gliding motility lipoprotein GldH [Bacteroidales bacterium]
MKISYRHTTILFLLAVSLSMFSCDQNRFFEQNIEIQDNRWAQEEMIKFQVDISDTNSLYNFYLNIRNANDYPFANIYLFIETTFPDANSARDTIEFQLADQSGQWLGEGYGKFKYSHFILREAMRFGQQGVYEFSVEQGMRKDTLVGITDIGIRLEYYP